MTSSTYTSSGTRLGGLRISRIKRSGSGWLLNFCSGDSETFRAMLDRVRALPPIWREWDAELRVWWLSDMAMQQLAHEIPAVRDALMRAESVGEERETDPWIRRMAQEAMRQESAQRRELAVPSVIRDSFAVLHLLPSAGEPLIKAGYRIAAKDAHPDRGGQHQAMIGLTRQYERALRWARQRQVDDDGDPPPDAA